jgi:non-specific serine/threonine protein kinase
MLALSPHGRLFLTDANTDRELARAFQAGSGAGLLYLDQATAAVTEDPVFAYWKDIARLHLSLFAATPNLASLDLRAQPLIFALPETDCELLLGRVPPMQGAEYVNAETLASLWQVIGAALNADIVQSGKDVAGYFAERHGSLNLLGRVCFHLAENKNSTDHPFAFLATYTRQLSTAGKPQHVTLNHALQEYAGSKNKNLLLRLLSPIHKAAIDSAFIHDLVDSGDIYQTLAWSPKTAHQFLQSIPLLEKSGIAVRVPDWWKAKRPTRPQVTLTLGDQSPSQVGLGALLDFSISVVLGNNELSQKEVQHLLQASENLVFFKGQWVEVDQEKLGDLLTNWRRAAQSIGEGLSFGESMRLLAGMDSSLDESVAPAESTYSRVVCGQWLGQALLALRNPTADRQADKLLQSCLLATLRPYQKLGVSWLQQLNRLQLGGILADDMGLGKTIQVIALLLLSKHSHGKGFRALLVMPASLLGNWQAELARFAPSLTSWIAHSSGSGHGEPIPADVDVVLTTYGTLTRLDWAAEVHWHLLIADEAQAIKNPAIKQTKALKALKAQHRLAMTGTPVENQLGDLWSLFDFVAPGLLGTAKTFDAFIKKRRKQSEIPGGESPYATLRQLVRPYILRRLKTDRSVIADLPEKTEIKSYCQLSKAQALLYQESVTALARDIAQSDGIKRRGLIFAYLMRFKQICNHPSHWVRDAGFQEAASGKFLRLREICELIVAKQEKVLVFTQFKEMTQPLHDFLSEVFGRSGLALHGATAVRKRTEMVEQFQSDDGPPFFVLSLKAGGTGLNLTAASHVIHFDRWWNPAIENQASDRAFRIGQRNNVLVHKFICKGTLEEKIDTLIDSKRALSQDLLDDGEATLLTELGNEELLKLVALDIHSAVVDQ